MRKPSAGAGKRLNSNKITQLIVAELEPRILDPWVLHTLLMLPCCSHFFLWSIFLKSKVCLSINILYFRIPYLITRPFTHVFSALVQVPAGKQAKKGSLKSSSLLGWVEVLRHVRGVINAQQPRRPAQWCELWVGRTQGPSSWREWKLPKSSVATQLPVPGSSDLLIHSSSWRASCGTEGKCVCVSSPLIGEIEFFQRNIICKADLTGEKTTWVLMQPRKGRDDCFWALNMR